MHRYGSSISMLRPHSGVESPTADRDQARGLTSPRSAAGPAAASTTTPTAHVGVDLDGRRTVSLAASAPTAEFGYGRWPHGGVRAVSVASRPAPTAPPRASIRATPTIRPGS